MITVEAMQLERLLVEASIHGDHICSSLNQAITNINNFHTPEKLSANYKALSQIFDDLVRIREVADRISISLGTPETPSDLVTP